MSEGQELKDLNVPRSYSGGTYSNIGGNRYYQKDVDTLARLGKKQVLKVQFDLEAFPAYLWHANESKRRFGFLSLFGFSCTILITWETVLALFQQAFQNGGPAGLAYGFLIAWFCTMSVYMVIAEMASIAPIAGGQYFWVSILAPERYKRFLSYITGWLTSIAWIATLATGSIFVGTIIQGLIILNYPNYEPHAYHGTFLCWAVIAVAVFINTVISGLLPMIEGFILVVHVLGFFAVLIPLVYIAPHGTAADVFKVSLNEGNWPTQGLSYCVGFIGNVATFVGADAAVHMSEEIENAALNVPRAIFTTMILNGITGYAMVLAVLFCIGDIDSVINTATGFPFIQVFYNGTRSYGGATAMTALVIGLSWCAVIGFLATASRMTWSFARDRGLPFHRFISKVEPRTSIPMVAIAVVTIIPCLLALIYIGSSTVFEDVVSLSVSGLYASYFIPCTLLLWRRTTGQILDRSSPDGNIDHEPPSIATTSTRTSKPSQNQSIADDDVAIEDIIRPVLVWGPWRVPGIWGTINNAFACVFITFVIFWSFWPPKTPATPENMNYSVLVTGTVVAFSIVYYYLWGKTQYKGPLIEREVRRMVRNADIT